MPQHHECVAAGASDSVCDMHRRNMNAWNDTVLLAMQRVTEGFLPRHFEIARRWMRQILVGEQQTRRHDNALGGHYRPLNKGSQARLYVILRVYCGERLISSYLGRIEP